MPKRKRSQRLPGIMDSSGEEGLNDGSVGLCNIT